MNNQKRYSRMICLVVSFRPHHKICTLSRTNTQMSPLLLVVFVTNILTQKNNCSHIEQSTMEIAIYAMTAEKTFKTKSNLDNHLAQVHKKLQENAQQSVCSCAFSDLICEHISYQILHWNTSGCFWLWLSSTVSCDDTSKKDPSTASYSCSCSLTSISIKYEKSETLLKHDFPCGQY
jgi:hypothetical protein